MSKQNKIDDLLRQYNVSLANMEAALTVMEYCLKNNQPISKLATDTIKDACDEVQEISKRLMGVVGE